MEPRVSSQRKTHKRRRQDKSPITARLVTDDHVRGDVGILSEDLWIDLFPSPTNDSEEPSSAVVHHVAISPWFPSSAIEKVSWTIVPVRASSALAHSTVQFAPSSLALQCFAESLQKVAPSRLSSHSRNGIEIRILDVVPLPLETVYVSLEADQARRLENGEGTFHGEHMRTNGHSNGTGLLRSADERLTTSIRESMSQLHVVHSGDSFSLPLPSHPITHISPPPAKITLCEPVAQGILTPRTKIIITQTGHPSKTRAPQPLPVDRRLQGVVEEDEDTSNDQFFSAAEDRYKTDAPIEDDSVTETETEVSEGDLDDLSDDSMEDMISLQAPALPTHSASGISTMQPGTPQTIGRKLNGISTPGSVFSNFTATTARPGGQKGRLFKTQSLLQPFADEILHPKPIAESDEECRVYVDINSLTKIGCFSGDWVRLEVAAEPPVQGAGLWGLGSFDPVESEPEWRPVKVFGLPESYSQRPVTKISHKQGPERRLSFFEAQVQKPASPTVYLSPILLANLENTSYCRLSPIKKYSTALKSVHSKVTSSSSPPLANEFRLSQISTPLSTEKSLQNAIFAGLKQYFATKTRVVKRGDLVAITIDETLGKTLYQPTSSEDGELDDLGLGLAADGIKKGTTKPTGVVWFRVKFISVSQEPDFEEEEDTWNGVASVDASSRAMMQSGNENGRLPGTSNSTWEQYLGIKQTSPAESGGSLMPELKRPHISQLQRRLRQLISMATSPRAIHLKMQPLAVLLISTQRNIGKAFLTRQACADVGLHTFTIDAYDILSEGGAGSDVKTVGFLTARAERAMSCGPENTVLVIRHIEALTADRMVTALSEILATVRVLVATTTEVDKIPDGVRGLFTHEMEMTAPDEWEREGILRNIIEDQSVGLAPNVDMSAVAVKTAALVAGDLVDVVDRALTARQTRLETLASSAVEGGTLITIQDILVAGGSSSRCLTKADFDLAVDAARKNFADAIGAPKIPNVGWADVGGLTNVKDAVMETIQLPLERPELFAKGMKKRSGILFYGPPGTGKTLLAKAIATEFSLNFFSVKGPELLNMYIGESEANVRRVFQRARDARPCVVFFDELDSVAPKRGNQGDSGGVMDRIVSQLLAELDGMSDGEDGGGGVFVIGATNRPDLLDAALLRPGRFDKMLYLGVSDTHEKQLTIMQALTRKFTLHPTLSLARVASHLPFTYTGADFYALCSDAMLKAVTRQASFVDAKVAKINSTPEQQRKGAKLTTAQFFDHHATKEDVAVMVMEEDFLGAMKELIPSVSAGELEHYQTVRRQFEKVDDGVAGKNGTSAPVLDNGVGKGKGKAPIGSSALPERPRSKGKGKEKVVVDRKGKGKASAWDDDEDEERGHDGRSGTNGYKGKGKGKAVDMSFQDDEDEELY